MSIKILIDMNLSPDWVPVLQNAGWSAKHWSTVGDAKATDRTIMDWAEANGYTVFTHDLDFGTILALTRKSGPSQCLAGAWSRRLTRTHGKQTDRGHSPT